MLAVQELAGVSVPSMAVGSVESWKLRSQCLLMRSSSALQGMTADIFRKYMAVDKKVLDGALRLILLRGPLGQCTFTGDFDSQVLDQTLDAFCTAL